MTIENLAPQWKEERLAVSERRFHLRERTRSEHERLDNVVGGFETVELGYKNHAGIDRAHGFIRGWAVTSAAAHDGA